MARAATNRGFSFTSVRNYYLSAPTVVYVYIASRSWARNEMLGLRKASSVQPNAINTDVGLYSTDCDSVYRGELWLKVLLQTNSMSWGYRRDKVTTIWNMCDMQTFCCMYGFGTDIFLQPTKPKTIKIYCHNDGCLFHLQFLQGVDVYHMDVPSVAQLVLVFIQRATATRWLS